MADFQAFQERQQAVGEGGITLGQLGRTPFQHVQIDLAGLERFSFDIAERNPLLLALLEQLNALQLEEFGTVAGGPCLHLKLWENLSLQTMGPALYRQHLVPLYQRILAVIAGTGQQLHVHYDGNLRGIAGDIAALGFAGLDSFTEPPEGDLTTAEAKAGSGPTSSSGCIPPSTGMNGPNRNCWIRCAASAAKPAPSRYCLKISEEVPPQWERTVPAILEMLARA